MTKINIALTQGALSTECRHESGVTLFTSAPKDNGGTGSMFSPTDLVAAALGSCVLTLMGLMARALNLELLHTSAEVEKHMVASPHRRIGKIAVHVRSKLQTTPEFQAKLEAAGRSCPVHASLHPDVVQEITFSWGVS